ncbi:EOGT (predicted) [Pycnogonum litorale]
MLPLRSYNILILFLCVDNVISVLDDVNLADEHWAFYFTNNRTAAKWCKENSICQHKIHLDRDVCWGYEDGCTTTRSYSVPNCSASANGWTSSKEEQYNEFFYGADFGFIKSQREELKVTCQPSTPDDTYLACSNYTRFCIAKNIMFDFNQLLTLADPIKYKDNILGPGLVGGHCKLNKDSLDEQSGHKSPLQSWYAEIEHFTEFTHRPISDGKCDVVVDRPSFIMKLDAPVNMYHHFCDFINLYNSLHVNGSFSRDVNIVLWDTMEYYGNFGDTWEAFTKHPLMNLEKWKGKKVCFRDAVFPLLPRMIFGMYYNMPLVPGCEASGLFHAFNRHILHNLKIKQAPPTGGKVRITLLSRSTKYRNILNEDQLLNSLRRIPNFVVGKVVFNWQVPFLEQLQIIQNTDILIGMHGAGLTHLLFLPDWAVIFELYNCEDENCYKDLARLRGVKYLTWEKPDKVHAKDEVSKCVKRWNSGYMSRR